VDQKESFPGVLYFFKPQGRNEIRTLLFHSGKLIYMGARYKDMDQIRKDFQYIYPILEEYRSICIKKSDLVKCQISNLMNRLTTAIPKLALEEKRYAYNSVKRIVMSALHLSDEKLGSDRSSILHPTKSSHSDVHSTQVTHGFVEDPNMSLFDLIDTDHDQVTGSSHNRKRIRNEHASQSQEKQKLKKRRK
jgi:hypothetical protein